MDPKPVWKVADIAGYKVETEDGLFLGELKDVLPTAANDVFIVAREDQEILIPALKTVVLSISAEEKKITVRLPKGLAEIYETKPKIEKKRRYWKWRS